MDFIKDEDALAPDEAALKTITNEDIDNVLHTLTPREEAVIRLRFGLKDGRCHTLEEVGSVEITTADMIPGIIERSKKAQKEWIALPKKERVTLLRKLSRMPTPRTTNTLIPASEPMRTIKYGRDWKML